MSLSIFGIRHHGPGSARSLLKALESLKPEVILVEGPADAQEAIPLLAHPEMKPPAALLLYVPDEPKRAAFYPFAVFSPEWQALHYGLTYQIPVRFMDLPQSCQLALSVPYPEAASRPAESQSPESLPTAPDVRYDPLSWIAEAAGYSDGERWWEHQVEQRRDSPELFKAILELMITLRQEVEAASTVPPNRLEILREAHMRQTIRAAQREGFERIAVVCGAWHAPALAQMPPAQEDSEHLKSLPKTKVSVTWVPWSYGRLAFRSGYGAGVESPGWYHHLWTSPEQVAAGWMTKVARLFREEDLPASPAHVIEATRLAEALAAMRDRPLPGLPELSEAIQAVFCFGSDTPMQLIEEKLIIGETLGQVPEETPALPLQQDLSREQKRLRLPPEALDKSLDLDLREPNDLARSHLLHRLNLLGIPWGEMDRVRGAKGTFHELWKLQWKPEFALNLIEASIWGNTVAVAAAARVCGIADKSGELAALTGLVEATLLASLPEAVSHLMARLQNLAAVTSDIPRLMESLPPLANVLRYGNVRQTDTAMVASVVNGIVVRICIGLPGACSSLNDEAAQRMYDRLMAVHQAIHLMQNEEHIASWHGALARMAGMLRLHALLAGRCCRLLFEQSIWDSAEVARHMGLALSTANEPAQAAAWVEGLLKGSGLLLHDDALWQLLDQWVVSLSSEAFSRLLPLLRRTFATFPTPERRQMGERVRRGQTRSGSLLYADSDIDAKRADKVLPLVAKLLGLEVTGAS